MRVAAAPFMGSASSGSVVLIVEMLGRDLTLGSKNRVEVSFRALDANGKVHGARNQAIALDLKPETRTASSRRESACSIGWSFHRADTSFASRRTIRAKATREL